MIPRVSAPHASQSARADSNAAAKSALPKPLAAPKPRWAAAEVANKGVGVTDPPPVTVAEEPPAKGQLTDAAVPLVPPTVVHWLVDRALASACKASWIFASAAALASCT